MQIIIQKDFDGYFESLTKRIVAMVKSPKYKTVNVTAGPYRPYAMDIRKVDDDTILIDYYSAIRNGFGSLSEQDLVEAAALLEA